MRHNAMTWIGTKSGRIYCPKCVNENGHNDYEQCSMRLGDTCDACKGDPEIIPKGQPVVLEHTTARIF